MRVGEVKIEVEVELRGAVLALPLGFHGRMIEATGEMTEGGGGRWIRIELGAGAGTGA